MQLRPSALSGELVASTLGTLQSFVRTRLGHWLERTPHDQEDEIGVVKFERFEKFAGVYPEYRYVFVGDSGQADALTARRMLAALTPDGSSGVITTFIHDLGQSEDDRQSRSSTFRQLDKALVIDRSARVDGGGRGVIVFRNYIEAALIAHAHAASLDNLVTAESLARITRTALEELEEIDFHADGKAAARERVKAQYLEDATEVYTRLTRLPSTPPSAEEDVRTIGDMLKALRTA
jgi:hypothetical protein